MINWDALEEAGHNLTHCGMLMPGRDLYYCENCGAVMLAHHEGVVVFHVPRGSLSTQELCYYSRDALDGKTLKEKLQTLQNEDWEKLKEI